MEPSTRTRIAFEVATKSLGADIISIAEKSSSLTKGESLRDTACNIQALGADAIILRHSSPGSATYLSNLIDVPIINAGDGAHEHPSQALLDLFTLREKLGDLNGKKLRFSGIFYLAEWPDQTFGACSSLEQKSLWQDLLHWFQNLWKNLE